MLMELTMRAATPTERLYAFNQSTQIAEQCGSPGYLFGDLDKTLSVFFRNWMQNEPTEDTPEFKSEFKAVLEMLRFDERYSHVLKNRATMTIYCLNHPEGCFNHGRDYAFRADTQNYSYLIRCIPDGEDNQVYIHPYRRERLDHHMKQAEKGIRFVTPDNREKFKIPDGESFRITTSGAGTRVNTARYVDDSHFEVVTRYGSYLYHIHEFAEWLERHEGSLIPLRSTLPEKCFSITSTADKIVIITKGEMGHRSAGARAEGVTAREGATALNESMGVTRAQEAAMLFGSIYGWDKPGADPKYYDEQGEPIKYKHRDRGDAR